MPDRCEVLPGDSVVARRGGGLLWVDAPGSPALVAALHACLGVSGPGADRVLSAVAGQVSSLAHGAASFALVLADTSGGAGTGVALWSGKGQPAVDGVPVSGSSVEGCTLASGFPLGQTLYVGPGQAAPQMPPGVAFDLVEGTVPGSGAMLQLAAAAPVVVLGRAAGHRRPVVRSAAASDAGFGSGARSRRAEPPRRSPASRPPSGGPSTSAAPVLRFDDGMVVTVDEDLVLGRRPDNHEMVTSGNARAGADRGHPERALLGPRRPPAVRPRGVPGRPRARSTARTSPGPRRPSGPSSSPVSPTRSPTATACSSAGPSSPSSSPRTRPDTEAR